MPERVRRHALALGDAGRARVAAGRSASGSSVESRLPCTPTKRAGSGSRGADRAGSRRRAARARGGSARPAGGRPSPCALAAAAARGRRRPSRARAARCGAGRRRRRGRAGAGRARAAGGSCRFQTSSRSITCEQPRELALVEHVRAAPRASSACAARAPGRGRAYSFSTQEAEEALERGDRARLARERRPPHPTRRRGSGAGRGGRTAGQIVDPLALQEAHAGASRRARRPSRSGRPAAARRGSSAGNRQTSALHRDPPSGRPRAASVAEICRVLRLTGLLRKKPWKRGFFYGR